VKVEFVDLFNMMYNIFIIKLLYLRR
jgi:hypothetical protein